MTSSFFFIVMKKVHQGFPWPLHYKSVLHHLKLTSLVDSPSYDRVVPSPVQIFLYAHHQCPWHRNLDQNMWKQIINGLSYAHIFGLIKMSCYAVTRSLSTSQILFGWNHIEKNGDNSKSDCLFWVRYPGIDIFQEYNASQCENVGMLWEKKSANGYFCAKSIMP